MKIAVLVAGARFDSQQRIINGIMESAISDGADIYLFTCDAWTYSTSYYSKGESAIFKLPNFEDYDGIILHGDTIYNKEIMNQVIRAIHKSGVPCISLNVRYEGMLFVGMENENGITKIVNHLIQVHHAKRLNYISGPAGNADSTGRLEAFKQAVLNNGLPLEEERIFYGDYHPESGKDAVEHFYHSDLEFPDAIVAANDEMALGAFYELQDIGYSVPDQILLTGYDNAFAGRNHHPKITSVDRPERELGQRAYEILKDYIEGQDVEEEELLCHPVFTESCGCEDKVVEDYMGIRKRYVKEKLHITTYSEIIKSSSADFTGVMTFEQLLEKIRKYVEMMDLKEFYLCLCVVEEPFANEAFPKYNVELDTTDLTSYAEEICIPLVYRDGKFSRYGRFSVKELLPREFTENRKGSFYTMVPLHYQERCYGYCVLGNSRLMMDSELFHLFVMNINNALENIRKQNMLNSMVERLNKMWVYDTLTGVFNRAGFFKFAPNIINEARRRGNDLFVLFLDLDGLKSVNDKYGHDEGDNFIKAMATVLNKARQHGELLMRYGGDEFVVLSQGFTPLDAEEYVARIQAGIEEYNAASNRPYKLEASMGYSIVKPSENMDMEAMVETADQEMYKVKNEKKRQKKLLDR